MTWPALTNIFWHILLTSHPPKVGTSQKPKTGWFQIFSILPEQEDSIQLSYTLILLEEWLAQPASRRHPHFTPVPLCNTWATMPVPWCNERRCTLIPDVAERGLRVRQLWDLCIFLTSWLCLVQFFLMWVSSRFIPGWFLAIASGDTKIVDVQRHPIYIAKWTMNMHSPFQQSLSSKIHATWTSHFKSINPWASWASPEKSIPSGLRRRLCKTKSLRRAGYVARQEKQPG